MNENEKEIRENEPDTDEKKSEAIDEIKEIVIEELAVDGVCDILIWVERLKPALARLLLNTFGVPSNRCDL